MLEKLLFLKTGLHFRHGDRTPRTADEATLASYGIERKQLTQAYPHVEQTENGILYWRQKIYGELINDQRVLVPHYISDSPFEIAIARRYLHSWQHNPQEEPDIWQQLEFCQGQSNAILRIQSRNEDGSYSVVSVVRPHDEWTQISTETAMNDIDPMSLIMDTQGFTFPDALPLGDEHTDVLTNAYTYLSQFGISLTELDELWPRLPRNLALSPSEDAARADAIRGARCR